ncbi:MULTISPECIES: double-strand break repair helicase AddA [Pacificibacter]|uniref:double-strand break repair helicase AddA n=1 Tax=Pacificibacter TaxID=1042323 RepID=UPI001C088932|nr:MULTISPECIES: double-strand break repair helicase AddA [Pacificibacter]MBU2936165.1 double-strand break repair helicase AddA [Pacificibacter marinus]MDO6614985.1 double-strand break repair helicase AddA [Pacificibacter sp. 1_MG-2023]
MILLDDATLRQIAAAKPDSSTWVSANAGSGKTKVLTDRVARLLLAGTPPQHILCLTYTKAAASEMQNRLFKRLGAWAMMPDDTLSIELKALAPDAVLTDEEMRHARTLFARAVETPGGLKIQTIHSFCGALLRRFPLEAGVSPQFKELDDRETNAILAEVLDTLAEGQGRDAIDAVATHISGQDDIDPLHLAQQIVRKREAFHPPATSEDIWEWFGLTDGYGEQDLLESVFLGDEDHALTSAATAMEASPNKTDVKAAVMLRTWIGAAPSISLLQDMIAAFLVKTGENQGLTRFGRTHSGLPTKKCATLEPEALRQLSELMERVSEATDNLRALQSAKKTAALHQFASALLQPYFDTKARLGLLDFDDLVQKARDLLSISSVAQWVLFRLDGGIDHILVDEAQDTSPDQWTVIRLLAEEFTVGEGARPNVTRTIFVVGDKKQSIYSFQGAAPEAFDQMKHHFEARLGDAGHTLQDIALQHSFRSSPAILNMTDQTFAQSDGQGVGGDTHHIAFFEDTPGRVDQWPLVEPEPAETDPDDWENPTDLVAPEHHSIRLAGMVARNVKDMIEKGSIPRKGSENTHIEPGDILILVRNRSGLFYPMIRALKKLNLPVAGADQLVLNDELAVKDMTSLLAFLSLQDDDLALAEALKSPLFGWSEQDLFSLAHKRTAATLWRELRARRDEWPVTADILDDLRKTSDFLRPYDLIQRVLVRHGGRKKFLARLGIEAEDGLDALLHQALHYETTQTPSLTGFIGWLGAEKIKLKRVLDESSNLIRVMTVHGSKGLEAPIVILPDTLRETSEPKDELITLEHGGIAWKSSKENNAEAAKEALTQLKSKNDDEERRLLYVAMTRAENWLIVAGAGKMKKDSSCWYQLVENGMLSAGAEEQAFPSGIGKRYAHGVWPMRTGDAAIKAESKAALPEWVQKPAVIVDDPKVFLSPSDLGGAKALAGPTSGRSEEDAMRYGKQLHLLLEHLPNHPVSDWSEIARSLLGSGELFATLTELEPIWAEATRVLTAQYAWDVFGKNSLAEIRFSGVVKTLNDEPMRGIIDRLIVEHDIVRIIDFKSNEIIPKTEQDVPEGLLRQLGAYSDICTTIYPSKKIEVAILWTRTATLMPLPHDMVMSALQDAATS